MTVSYTQVSAIYAKVQLGDNRKDIDSVLLNEWYDILNRGGEEFEDMVSAVTEFRATQPGRYLEPGFLVQIAKRFRQDRAEQRHHAALTAAEKPASPPIPRDIFNALSKAWNDREAYLRAEARLNEYLVSVGAEPVRNTWKNLPPIGQGV